jgi:hypothetical protein
VNISLISFGSTSHFLKCLCARQTECPVYTMCLHFPSEKHTSKIRGGVQAGTDISPLLFLSHKARFSPDDYPACWGKGPQVSNSLISSVSLNFFCHILSVLNHLHTCSHKMLYYYNYVRYWNNWGLPHWYSSSICLSSTSNFFLL